MFKTIHDQSQVQIDHSAMETAFARYGRILNWTEEILRFVLCWEIELQFLWQALIKM